MRPYGRNIARWLKAASTVEHEQGRAWYADANAWCSRVAAQYDLSLDTVAGVVAALSPMVRWNRNQDEAVLMIRRYREQADKAARAEARPGAKPHPVADRPDRAGHSAYGANLIKAWDILRWKQDPENVLRGPKVTAFYRLLRSPLDPVVVCVDSVSILAAVGVDPNPLVSSDDAKQWFDRPREMAEIRQAYRRAAWRRGLAPSQVQAIVWVTWRNERDKA